MAISVDPLTHVIFVPKDDLTLVQSSPTEIREMNLNWFRLQLKSWEDSEEGIVQLKTHTHNTEVSLGGLTFARVIEILEPYSVTFEDGQYAVNLTGANSNVGDKVNVNQVSVRSQNSAGMTSSPDIEYSSFNGGVTYDETSPYTGTVFPTGTPRQPINNVYDAKLIAEYRGFTTGFIIGDLTVPSDLEISGFTLIGTGKDRTTITIPSAALVENCTYVDAHVTGYLDGNNVLNDCLIDNLHYIKGYIESCVLAPGTITLGGSDTAHFLDCFSGVPGTGTPTIDMGDSGQPLALRNYNGGIKLTNKSGPEPVSIDMNSGQIKIDMTTVTNGMIMCRGVGKLTDADTGDHIHSGTYGNLVIYNELVNVPGVIHGVWGEDLSDHIVVNSAGETLLNLSTSVWDEVVSSGYTAKQLLDLVACVNAAKLSGADTATINIRDLADTKNRVIATVDNDGNRTSVTLDVS